MSISSRSSLCSLNRAVSTVDAYGVMSSEPTLVTRIKVSITKNTLSHDYKHPLFNTTEYMGITSFVGVRVGDIIRVIFNDEAYIVKDLGDRGTQYQSLFLERV